MALHFILRVAAKLSAGACAAMLSSCAITIEHTDVFVSRDAHRPVEQLELPATLERSAVKEVSLQVAGRRFLGYHLASRRPTSAVLFFPGNGYGASAALSRLSTLFYNESTDLYVVSYVQPSQAQPRVGEVFELGAALADHASATTGIPKKQLVAVGHSLGGWITLNLASQGGVGCTVIVGSGTTAAATAAHLIKPSALNAVLSFRPSVDVALLDNLALAQRVRVPTLVVGSEADEVMPVAAARAIHDHLKQAAYRELHVAQSTSHGAYLRDSQVVDVIRSFLRSRCNA